MKTRTLSRSSLTSIRLTMLTSEMTAHGRGSAACSGCINGLTCFLVLGAVRAAAALVSVLMVAGIFCRLRGMTMTIDEIKQLQQSISTAAWKLDLWTFSERLGSDASHEYTQEMFRQFNALSKAINRFGAETLHSIVGGE